MRRRTLVLLAAALVTVVGGLTATTVLAQGGGTSDVTTAGYNNLRDNWDPNEPTLNATTVTSKTFVRLFTTAVKGQVYAQPLVYGGTVIATTEQAYAYGLNATTGAIEWTDHFGTPFAASSIGCSDLTPYVGSTATPVIDPSTGVVYITTRLEVGGKGLANAHWYLQAVSASTGQEQPGFPVEITGTPSNTPGVPFNDNYAMQRPALLLLDGVVYMAFASDCDDTPYRGIVVGVDESSGAITTMWSDESGVGTDENSQAGIWQGGGGLVSTADHQIILATGNGVSSTPAPADQPPPTLSESVVQLTVNGDGSLTPTSFFSPTDAPDLDANDEDLGSGGPVALPPAYFGTASHPNLLVESGKDGRVFLLDADDLGGSGQGPGGTDDTLETFGPDVGVWGHPAVYGGEGGWVYYLESGGGGYLRALSYGTDADGNPTLSEGGTSQGTFGYTSGSPLVTSNGTTPGSGLVWVVYCAGPGGGLAQLRAYSAVPVNGTLKEVWHSAIGTASKFSTPTASNGVVYVGTRLGRIIAFGLKGSTPVEAAATNLGSVPVGHTATVTVPATITQNLTVTGPVTTDGVEQTGGPATPPATVPAASTAGPTTIPPAGSGPVAPGVVKATGPPTGTRLRAGATVSIRVTFRPNAAGPVDAELSIPTSAGVRTVSLSGYGTAPGLSVSTPPLDFGTLRTGAGGKTDAVTFTNTDTVPERVTAETRPGAPYRVKGLPPVGFVLAPERSVTATVTFDPTAAGSFPSALSLTTDHGGTTLPVSGSAATGTAHLVVTPSTVDAGSVPVGRSVTVSFDVANQGTVALRITRAIAPLGAFTSPDPMPEGIAIDPGGVLHESVTFRPTAPGPASGRYVFNTDDGQGEVVVDLVGTGVG